MSCISKALKAKIAKKYYLTSNDNGIFFFFAKKLIIYHVFADICF